MTQSLSSAAVALGVCPTSNVAGSPDQTCNSGGSCTSLVKWNPGIIYRLTSPSGKAYVGQTRYRFHKRLRDHRNKRSAIGSAIRRYGEHNFIMEKLLVGVSVGNLNCLECFSIGLSVSLSPFGYNMTSGGDTAVLVSGDTRLRMSQSAKGKLISAETRARMGAVQRGRHRTEETRAKMGASHRGRKVSPEGRARMSAAMKKRALTWSCKGRVVSQRTKEKLASANRGRKPSSETRLKMSAAQKRRYSKNEATRLAGSSS